MIGVVWLVDRLLGSQATEVGIYAIVVPALLVVIAGLVRNERRMSRVETLLSDHLAQHRREVWTPSRRRRETGHD